MPTYKFNEKLLCPHCGNIESDYPEDYAEHYICKGLNYTFIDFVVCSKCGVQFDVLHEPNSCDVHVGKLVMTEINNGGTK